MNDNNIKSFKTAHEKEKWNNVFFISNCRDGGNII